MSEAVLKPGSTAFMDRDGTINVSPPEGDYLSDPDRVRLLPGVASGIATLNQMDIHTVVVTNQRGIGRGLMTEGDLSLVNQRVEELLANEGAKLDAIIHCPHLKGECDCRKPLGGMFRRAEARVPGVKIAGGAMIGDSLLDMKAGRNLGLTTVLVGSADSRWGEADIAVEGFAEAVRVLTLPQPSDGQ